MYVFMYAIYNVRVHTKQLGLFGVFTSRSFFRGGGVGAHCYIGTHVSTAATLRESFQNVTCGLL